MPSRTKVASRLGIVTSTLTKIAERGSYLDELDALLKRQFSEPSKPLDPPGVEHHGDGSATVVSDAEKAVSWTREGLLKAHGFNKDEWVVVRARANRWGTPDGPNEQLRID
ncbi:MAG TPA: hypothetical protein VGP44_05180, partial [Gemmatimonadales bacterium]|nr:hypothetical protein [Gemmatimonadales bacterium]